MFIIFLRIVVDCGPLVNHVNGKVEMSSETTFMSTATYTCNTGYNLIGPISRSVSDFIDEINGFLSLTDKEYTRKQ